jgi:ferredoxin
MYVDGPSRAALKDADEAEIELISGLLNARPNSRLSCQIEVVPEFEGLEITVAQPEA